MSSPEFTIDLLLSAFRAGKSGLSESQFRRFVEEKLHGNAETKEGVGRVKPHGKRAVDSPYTYG